MPVHKFSYHCQPCVASVDIRVEEKADTLRAINQMLRNFVPHGFHCFVCGAPMDKTYGTNATFLDVATAVGECA